MPNYMKIWESADRALVWEWACLLAGEKPAENFPTGTKRGEYFRALKRALSAKQLKAEPLVKDRLAQSEITRAELTRYFEQIVGERPRILFPQEAPHAHSHAPIVQLRAHMEKLLRNKPSLKIPELEKQTKEHFTKDGYKAPRNHLRVAIKGLSPELAPKRGRPKNTP